MRLDLIHYGSKEFDPDKFNPVNNHGVKPRGGFWASPVNSKHSWKEWCLDNQFGLSRLETSFEFVFDGNTFVIDCVKDCEGLPMWELMPSYAFIDFEAMAEKYDAVYMTTYGEWDTRFSNYHLYGWDCESVLIMNPSTIIQKEVAV